LYLAVPRPDGSWTNVSDRYGRPVRLTWSQLSGVAQGQPAPFAAPPAPKALTLPSRAALPAFSKTQGGAALAWAVEQGESGGVDGLVSPKGALGVMQLMPATIARYAPQLGLPIDAERARTDPAYNRAIGQRALFDLTGRYMTGAEPTAGLGLALAAYNAGEGHLTGFRDAKGYHPGWLATIGDPRSGNISLNDWVKRIPFPETRAYVEAGLRRASNALQESR
ncbi:MAG: transglycosylase SLT domain-containing protein, partial [Caulobacteraceae bacterium]